jgi:hypothetical protein
MGRIHGSANAAILSFPQKARLSTGWGRSIRGSRGRYSFSVANREFSPAVAFALRCDLCYSQGVVDEQWSLPVAVCLPRLREVGSWFVGSDGLRMQCIVEPL